MAFLRGLKDLQYTVAEVKVREATSTDAWGPEVSLMREIATFTYKQEDYPKLFAMLYKRVTDIDHIMHVQKSLILIHFLINHGSNRFLRDCKKNLLPHVKKLRKYKHFNINNQDDAELARKEAKKIVEMLSDEELLEKEREKAKKTPRKRNAL